MNRKQKKKRDERKLRIAQASKLANAVDENQEPGRASTLFVHAATLPEATEVVLWCRESTAAQQTNANLLEQQWELHRRRRELGFIDILPTVAVVASATRREQDKALRRLVNRARKVRAVILGESVARFLRPSDWHPSRNPDALPSVADLEHYTKLFDGVTVATVVGPDVTPEEVRSYETRRGRYWKKEARKWKQPGAKKTIRKLFEPLALTLKEEGWSVRMIAEYLGPKGVSRSTVGRWVGGL